MRFPVYPADLDRKNGFKRIAKVIHRNWLGPEPLNLSAARDILARCFGYKNYHDVRQSADEWPDNAPAPDVTDLRAAILVALANNLHAESISNSVDLEKLTAFVESLPLYALQTYRSSRLERSEG